MMEIANEVKNEIKKELLFDADIDTTVNNIQIMHLCAIDSIEREEMPIEAAKGLAESIHDVTRLLQALK